MRFELGKNQSGDYDGDADHLKRIHVLDGEKITEYRGENRDEVALNVGP